MQIKQPKIKAERRERKMRQKMHVSGKSVFVIKKILDTKSSKVKKK